MSPPSAVGTARAVWALGLTQIVGYGSLQYSFGGLAPSMAADFGWSEQWVFGVLSLSLLIGGLVAPLAGSWADRYGAARLMTWGSLAAAAALAATALAPNAIGFSLGLIAIAIASAFVLYATAFAALAQLAPAGAGLSITYLTLIAGFASTLFWPLTTLLHDHLGWRMVYLLFAALNLLICAPVHLWLARHTTRRRAATQAMPRHELPHLPKADQIRVLLLMLGGFALLGFVSSAVLMQMVPLLTALGLGASGVLVSTLFGPAQVLSRVINMRFGRRLSQPALAIVAAALMPLGVALLVTTAPLVPGAAAFAILFGLGSGLSSIVSGTLPLALFGSDGYGRRLGWISAARQICSALAPFAFALVATATSHGLALTLVVAVGLASATCFTAIWLIHARTRTTETPA